METKVKSSEIYNGKVVKVFLDDVVLDDGSMAKREVIKHLGGACIALKSKRGTYYMVKQYRYAQGMDMYEFCAGKLEKDEDPDTAILREASEELGVTVQDLKSYGYMVPTCGYSSERIYLYSGKEKDQVGQHLDQDERINIYEFTLDEIEKMIKEGVITDAKTICLVYYLKGEDR